MVHAKAKDQGIQLRTMMVYPCPRPCIMCVCMCVCGYVQGVHEYHSLTSLKKIKFVTYHHNLFFLVEALTCF